MRTVLLTGLLIGSFIEPSGAKNLAQELVEEQYKRLSPATGGHADDEMGYGKLGHETGGGEDLVGDLITQSPVDLGEDDDAETLISLEEYLSDLPADGGTDEVFLLTTGGDSDGNQKLRIDPEFLKKVEIPEKKKELSWWEEVIEFLEDLLA